MLVFLDFDGVLHHFFPRNDCGPEQNEHFYYLPFFEKVARDYDFKIVISSTWRTKRNWPQPLDVFSPDIRKRIIGVTPVLEDGHAAGGREKEVLEYLRRTDRDNEPWVALDDYTVLYDKGTCVLCNDGFGEDEAQRLREALLDPKAYAQKHPAGIFTDAQGKIKTPPIFTH